MRGTMGKTIMCVGLLLAAPAGGQALSVVNSPHNLSASGTGAVRSATEDQVCIFCHAPHNASPIRPLWNRAMPVDAYTIYTSPALDAEPGQPTGASKMCLSCHDGTIAIGAVVSRQTPIPMAGGVTTMPQGPGLIGTDLRDDHPISFRFDSSLAAADPKLRQPASLPHEIRLDANGELQCTSCHDAHNNVHGGFLVMSNAGSALCVSCHQMGSTTVQEHRECSSCHVSHGSPSGPYLLTRETVGETCLACHDGSHPRALDVASQVAMPSSHETFGRVGRQGPNGIDPQEVSCADCHEPHTMTHGSTQAPLITGGMGAIDGVSAAGSPLLLAQNEYEVCFKCHAEENVVRPVVPRLANSTNARLEFDVSAVSYHPVEAPGRNPDVPSLKPGWSTQDMIRCSDCHAQSDLGAGGMAASGVHGSPFRPLLKHRYSTADYTSENPQAYALCYSCHDRNSILNDESFPLHRLHVVESRASCAACHDAHGISSLQGSRMSNTHLINFDTSTVLPSPDNGRLEFRDNGILTGTCTLRCHGVNHNSSAYP
jgi:predicted CXXCH cytochrome family protein